MSLLWVLASFIFAQEPVRNGPRLFFETDIYDLGEVKQFSVVEHDFPFVNNGTETLIISKVKSGCGCTRVSASAMEIPPGGKGVIHVSYTTDLESGEKVKPAYIYTNIPNEAPKRLELKAKVIPALACEPSLLDFGDFDNETASTQKASLQGYAFGEVKIVAVLSENPNVKAELADGGKSLAVTLMPGLKVGKIYERIRLQTDNEKFKILPGVTVSAKVKGDLEITPQLVDFEAFDHGENSIQTREVLVKSRARKPFHILDVKVVKAPIEAKVVTVEKGRVYKILFTAGNDFRTAKATVKTDDPRQPEFQITLFGKRQ